MGLEAQEHVGLRYLEAPTWIEGLKGPSCALTSAAISAPLLGQDESSGHKTNDFVKG